MAGQEKRDKSDYASLTREMVYGLIQLAQCGDQNAVEDLRYLGIRPVFETETVRSFEEIMKEWADKGVSGGHA